MPSPSDAARALIEGDDADRTLNEEVHRICVLEGGYPDAWPRHEACPCCGEAQLRPTFRKFGFNHDRCRSCDFVCLNPYPSDELVRKIYQGGFYTRSRELFEYPRLKNGDGPTPFTAPQDLVETMIGKAVGGRHEGEWLDVGGGLGALADRVRSRYPGWKVTLNEFNERSIELARDLFDLDVSPDDADALAATGRRFDVISAVAVLEHIPDPLAFVKGYAALLRPGGVMALLIPQFTQLNADVSRATATVVLPPFHVSLFRTSNVSVLMNRAGAFSEVRIDEDGPPGFSLLHHYDYHEYWDITIPTVDQPTPQGFMTRPYPEEMAHGLNALGVADAVLADHFARTDGRIYLTIYGVRSAT